MIGLRGLGPRIRRDLSKITTGKFLNTADVQVYWAEDPSIGGNELHARFDSPTAGRALVAKPDSVFDQSISAAVWTIPHEFAQPPLVTLYGPADVFFNAQIQHTAGVVTVTNEGGMAGTAALALPDYVHVQELPLVEWTVEHSLGIAPLVQIINDEGEVISASITHLDENHFSVNLSEAAVGKAMCLKPDFSRTYAEASDWQISHQLGARPLVSLLDDLGEVMMDELEYLGLTFDANDESTYAYAGSSAPVSNATYVALIHFVEPTKTGVRTFSEVKTGDMFCDFVHDVPLDGKKGIRFLVDGKWYVQKDVGEELPKYWDLVIGGKRMFRTVVLTLQKRA